MTFTFDLPDSPILERVPSSVIFTAATTKLIGVPICPDLLSIDDLGEADTRRGRLVRLLIRCLGRPQ